MLNRRMFIGAVGATAMIGPASSLAQTPTPEMVFNDPDIPPLGNPDGDVTIVEFFDYQCPFCKTAHPGLIDTVRDDGKVKLIMRDWPIFGEASIRASTLVLSLISTPERYEIAHNALMATEGRLAKEDVDRTLVEAGFDVGALAARYDSQRESVDAIIGRNNGLAEGFRLGGTPTFVIGRKVYGGLLDPQGLRQAILEARELRG